MPTPQRFGSYLLLKKIATGGMAELYKARKSGEQGFEKLLAVKKILPHLSTNEEFLGMFVDEARVAALLDHQNIVQIYDLGKIEDTYCIVMEYVRGRDLKAVAKRARELGNPVSVEHACFIACAMLSGLSYAHRRKDKGKDLGIVHRDISPQNVLVSYEGEVKITDFGIAKAATQSHDTRVGVLKGKVSYMSPEQARGLPLDQRSDIFSAGVVFYELLTGKKLFRGDTDIATLEKVREARVEPLPSELNTGVSRELEAILLRALAADKGDRYQSAPEMEGALQEFMRSTGYMTGNYSLSQYMFSLFRKDIEEELAEEGDWDQTLTTKTPVTDARAKAAGPKPAGTPSLRPGQARARVMRPAPAGRSALPRYLVAAAVLAAGLAGAWYMLKMSEPKMRIKVEQPIPVRAGEAGMQPVGGPATMPGFQGTPDNFVKAVPQAPEEHTPAANAVSADAPPRESAPGRDRAAADAAPAAPAEETPTRPGGELTGIAVNSAPSGAAITLDGADTGKRTPALLSGLAAGRQYRVALRLEGYDIYEETVRSPDAGRAALDADLKRQYGTLNVDARPWFFVIIDGEDKGMTPLAGIRLTAGQHEMVLANTKLRIKRRLTVRVEPDKTTSILIDPRHDPQVREITR